MPSHTYKYPGSLDLSTCDSLYISSFKTTLSHTYSLKYPRRLLVGIIVDFLSLSLSQVRRLYLFKGLQIHIQEYTLSLFLEEPKTFSSL